MKKMTQKEVWEMKEQELAKGRRGVLVGQCAHCGFSLLADEDTKCPRCKKKIKLEKKQ